MSAYPYYSSNAEQGHWGHSLAATGVENVAAPVTMPAMSGASAAPVDDNAQVLYRAGSSMSGPMAPPPPMAVAAIFDMHSQSERTSTEMSYYERDPSSMGLEQVQQQGGSAAIQDPLGRLSACSPIVSFGFGGALVTMFPHSVQRLNIYDSGKASRIAPGMLQLRQLSETVSSEALGSSTLSLLGTPLFAGENTRSALLKRRDAAVSCANAWIEAASASSSPPSKEEIALYRAIIAMLSTFGAGTDPSKQPDMAGACMALGALSKLEAASDGATDAEAETPLISHGTRQQLEQIETQLLLGNRKAAVDAACSQGLWTHALIIASCTGKELWQTVVSAYTKEVLDDGFSSLGVQYRMFSGLGADALDEPQAFGQQGQGDATSDRFITAASIGAAAAGGQDAGLSGHLSASGGAGQTVRDKTTLSWVKTARLMLANRTPGDQDALMALGDRLKSEGRVVEAHICYALTQKSKDLFMPESADAQPRVVLLGVNETMRGQGHGASAFGMAMPRHSYYYRKPLAMFCTELYELLLALGAVTAAEAQPTSSASGSPATAAATPSPAVGHVQKPAKLLCLPHLQAYKLFYAWWLVDCGQTALASRHCDAVLSILATLPQGTAVPFISNSLVQELRNLRERLSGAGMTSTKAAEIVGDDSAIGGASTKSWLSRAMPRPSFTSLMTVFDSSIDKFITGADGNRISLESNAAPGKFEVGPDRQGATVAAAGEPARAVSGNPPRPLGAVTWDGRVTPSPHPVAASMSMSSNPAADAYLPSYGSPRQSLDGRPSMSSVHRDSNPEPPRMFTPSNLSAAADSGTLASMMYPSYQQQPQQQPPRWGDPDVPSREGTQSGFATPAASFVPSATALSSAMGAPGAGVASGGGIADNTMMPAIPPSFSGYAGQPGMSQGGGSAAPNADGAVGYGTGTGTGYNMNNGSSNNGNVGDDEEDMFGFSKKRPASTRPSQNPSRPSAEVSRSAAASARPSTEANNTKSSGKTDEQQDDKGGSGVFGLFKSLWGGRKNQANLGEESHFVYDPALGRWVDKSASGDQQESGPPPPPPPSMIKFQPQQSSSAPPAPPVANPAMQHGPAMVAVPTPPIGAGNVALPPTALNGMMATSRPASAAPPPLAGTGFSRAGTPGSVFDSPSPAMGAGMPPPTASTGSHQARRRGARSKYVDLMGQ
ncbi:hypothetical protein LPJ75_001070 [Coemansia sp. RSA 2598]|nr:hypothetical protein LPJ75_001070 [Coemansia sp. RSA 2598]